MNITIRRYLKLFLLLGIIQACQNTPTTPDKPIVVVADSAAQSHKNQIRTQLEEPLQHLPKSKFAPAIREIAPRSDVPVGLLLGFDTDTSQHAQSYQHFFDANQSSTNLDEDFATNRTLMFSRHQDQVSRSGELNCLASPQDDGFLYLGLVTYREKAKVQDEWYHNLQERAQKEWPFEYTGVWKSKSYKNLGEAVHQQISQLKDTLNSRYALDSLQFITDYEKPSYLVPGLLLTEGYYSLIHGGASWFNAYEYNKHHMLGKKYFSPALEKWTTPERIRSATAKLKEEFGEQRQWSGTPIDYIYDPTFTLARKNGRIHLIGLLNMDANSSRTFLASFDAGPAPSELVGRNSFPLKFSDFERVDPDLIDVFISPNFSTIFVLTKTWIYAIDVTTKRTLYQEQHELVFNKVVMVEWATGNYVKQWEKALQD